MSLFTGQKTWKPTIEPITGNGDTLNNLQKFTMGAGSSRWEANISDGMWLGADTFATAPFSVDFLGNLLASSVTIKNSTGSVLIDSDSSTQDFVQVLNSKLNTETKKILSDFDFGTTDYAGAVKSGDITWNSTTGEITGGSGVVVYRGGILGAKEGVAQFTLNASTGDATLAGTLSAVTGSFGATTIASGGNIKLGKTAYSDTTNAGFWLGDDSGTTKLHIGASSTKLLRYDGTDLELLGGEITGSTIQTATGDRRIVIGTDQYIRWKNGSDTEGSIWNDGSGNMVFDADTLLYLRADGSGDDIYIIAGDDILQQSNSFYATCTGNWNISEADAVYVRYNSDDDEDSCAWINDAESKLRMFLDPDGNLNIDGGMSAANYGDFGEYFESVDEFSKEKIPFGTSVVLEEGKIKPASEGEEPIGVISATAGFVLNQGSTEAGTQWGGKYIRDDNGSFIYEESKWWRAEGVENFKKETGQKGERRESKSNFYDMEKPPKGWTILKEKMARRKKLNPDWDSKQEFIPRKERPEWNIVGLVGRVRILKGQPIGKNWIKLSEISKTTNEYLIK